MSRACKSLTQAQLVVVCALHLFPDSLQDEVLDSLQEHYQAFRHDGNPEQAKQDIHNTARILSWALGKGQRIGPSLPEHLVLFGNASAQDVMQLVAHRAKEGGRIERVSIT